MTLPYFNIKINKIIKKFFKISIESDQGKPKDVPSDATLDGHIINSRNSQTSSSSTSNSTSFVVVNENSINPIGNSSVDALENALENRDKVQDGSLKLLGSPLSRNLTSMKLSGPTLGDLCVQRRPSANPQS